MASMFLPLILKTIAVGTGANPLLFPTHQDPLLGVLHAYLDICEVTLPPGGFSGATVIKFTAKSPLPEGLKDLELEPGKDYIFKYMEPGPNRSLDKEIEGYDAIAGTPLAKLYVSKVASSPLKNWVILTVAPGTLLSTRLIEGSMSLEEYNRLAKNKLTVFFNHFIQYQTEKPKGTEVDHVQQQTLRLVLERFSKALDQQTNIDYVLEDLVRIDGKEYQNPLSFFLTLSAEDAIPANLSSISKETFSSEQIKKLLLLLKPRTVSQLPTDPTASNETDQAGPQTWFDMGSYDRSCQLFYALCKREGPFAQLFMLISHNLFTVTESQENGFNLSFKGISPEALQRLSEIHSPENIDSRLRDCDPRPLGDIDAILAQKPFYLTQLFFFGWRQFGSDYFYRKDDPSRKADWILFTKGIHHIKMVFNAILKDIDKKFPEQDFEAIINTPENYACLQAIVLESFAKDLRG